MNTSTTEALQPLYSSVQQFSDRHQAFTVGSLRGLIFNANTNGLNQSLAIVRVGRRVLINEDKFFGWVETKAGEKHSCALRGFLGCSRVFLVSGSVIWIILIISVG